MIKREFLGGTTIEGACSEVYHQVQKYEGSVIFNFNGVTVLMFKVPTFDKTEVTK